MHVNSESALNEIARPVPDAADIELNGTASETAGQADNDPER
jgi:hypothetical protein